MTEPQDTETPRPPQSDDPMWARRRGKNVAILWSIIGLAALFFVITILRMS